MNSTAVLVIAVLCGLAAVPLSYAALGRLRPGPRKLATGCAAVLAALGGAWAGWRLCGEGTWRCELCCAMREELHLGPLRIWTGAPEEPAERLAMARRYRRWVERGFGPCEDHEWTRTGCHSRGASVACAPRLDTWYRALTLLGDRALARALLERFRAAGSWERWRTLLAWSVELGPSTGLAGDDGPLAPEARRELTERVREWTLAGR